MSSKEEIIRLSLEGLSTTQIANRTGSSANAVRVVRCNARKRGIDIPLSMSGKRHGKWTMPERTLKYFRAEGKKRKLGPYQLALRVIGIIARDKLLTAIIDDSNES